jgi:hypothetical protein
MEYLKSDAKYVQSYISWASANDMSDEIVALNLFQELGEERLLTALTEIQDFIVLILESLQSRLVH